MNTKYIRIKKGRIYISKSALLIICVVLFIAAFLFITLSRINQKPSTTRPLGVAPTGAQNVPKNSIDASRFMISKIKEEHENKLTVIFYHDSYKNQNVGLKHAHYLADALTSIQPFADLGDMITFKILTSGSVCFTENKTLYCEPRHIEALQKLGIEHIKIIVLYPGDFTPAFDYGFGADSVVLLPTKETTDSNFKKELQKQFMLYFEKSLGADDVKGNKDAYLRGAISCFYGKKESYSANGKFYDCSSFKKQYPDFWKHDVK